jgi:CXXC-20-CXXC protein
MQKCQVCSTPFEKKDVMHSIWNITSYAPIRCKNCGSEHKVKYTTRLVYGLCIWIPLFIDIVFRESLPIFAFPLMISIVLIALIILTPYLARYNLKS